VLRTEFDRSAIYGAGFSTDDLIEVGTVVFNVSEDFITSARFDGGCPVYFRVRGGVISLSIVVVREFIEK
jgi:hypothetical protein